MDEQHLSMDYTNQTDVSLQEIFAGGVGFLYIYSYDNVG